MAAERSVKVRVDAVVGPYKAAMAQAQESTRKFTNQSSADLQRLGGSMQRTGTMMTVGLTAPLVLLAKQAVDTAASAQESANRMNVVFGQNAAVIEQWSEGAARSMGLARHEAQSAASTFGSMFDAMGLSGEKVVDLSTNVVQLAADLGSFHDIDPSQMLDKLRSGLVGEVEPLRQVGILLNAATVEAKAMELGLVAAGGEASEAAKVQARYALIVEQAGKAIGDYERTNTDATNAQRTASAAYKEAMAELGDGLLPIVAKGALTVADLAEAFQGLPEGAQMAIIGFGGLVAAAGPLLLALGSVVRNLEHIRKVAPAAGSALGLAAVGLGTAFAVNQLLPSIVDVKGLDTFNAMADALTRTSGALNEMSAAAMAAHLESNNMTEVFANAGITIEDLHAAAQQGMGAVSELGRSLYDAGEITAGQLQSLGGFVKALEEAEVGAASNAAATSASNKVLGEYATAASDAAGATDELAGSLSDLHGSTTAVDTAQDNFNRMLLTWADSVAAAKIEGDGLATSLSDMNMRGLDNRQTLRDLVGAMAATIDTMREQGRTEGEVADATANMRNQLMFALQQLGFNKDETARYIAQLGLVPGNVHTDITMDASQAMAELNRLAGYATQVIGGLLGGLGGVFGNVGQGLVNLPTPNLAPPPIPVGLRTAVGGGGPAGQAASGAAGGGAARAADEAARAAEEAEQRRRTIEDNRYAAANMPLGQIVGLSRKQRRDRRARRAA